MPKDSSNRRSRPKTSLAEPGDDRAGRQLHGRHRERRTREQGHQRGDHDRPSTRCSAAGRRARRHSQVTRNAVVTVRTVASVSSAIRPPAQHTDEQTQHEISRQCGGGRVQDQAQADGEDGSAEDRHDARRSVVARPGARASRAVASSTSSPAPADVVHEPVERIDLVEAQRVVAAGREVDPARDPGVDAHEHPGGQDEEANSLCVVRPGHVLAGSPSRGRLPRRPCTGRHRDGAAGPARTRAVGPAGPARPAPRLERGGAPQPRPQAAADAREPGMLIRCEVA